MNRKYLSPLIDYSVTDTSRNTRNLINAIENELWPVEYRKRNHPDLVAALAMVLTNLYIASKANHCLATPRRKDFFPDRATKKDEDGSLRKRAALPVKYRDLCEPSYGVYEVLERAGFIRVVFKGHGFSPGATVIHPTNKMNALWATYPPVRIKVKQREVLIAREWQGEVKVNIDLPTTAKSKEMARELIVLNNFLMLNDYRVKLPEFALPTPQIQYILFRMRELEHSKNEVNYIPTKGEGYTTTNTNNPAVSSIGGRGKASEQVVTTVVKGEYPDKSTLSPSSDQQLEQPTSIKKLKRSIAQYVSPLRVARIFNDDWLHGGRVFADFQRMPHKVAKMRRNIRIDSDFVTELDISASHALLSYLLYTDATPPDSMYPCDDPMLKTLFKQINIIGLNAKSSTEMFRAITSSVLKSNPADDEGMKIRHAISSMSHDEMQVALDVWLDYHAPIAHLYFQKKPLGLKLQKAEGDLAVSIMLKGMDAHQIILPMHDGWISKQSFSQELREIVAESFVELTGKQFNHAWLKTEY